MTTFSGRSTAITRGATLFRFSRAQCSSSATSMMLSFFATPTRSQKSWIAAGVMQPAIEHAEQGFPVSEIIGREWANSVKKLSQWPETAATYLPGGKAPEIGELFRNPKLAASYRAVVQHGRDGYYKGPIAKTIVAFSEANGGYFSLQGLRRPHFDMGRAGLDEVPRVRRLGVAAQRTRHRGTANPQHSRRLRRPRHGTQQRRLRPPVCRGQEARLRRPRHVLRRPRLQSASRRGADFEGLCRAAAETHRPEARGNRRPAGRPETRAAAIRSTSPVVDKDRNCCSLIQSNYDRFGSRIVPGDVGFVIQNRGSSFTLDEHARSIGSSRTSGRSTRSFPRSSRRTASPGSRSA